MRRSVRLRPWQKRALTRLGEEEGSDFLAVATPGAGKTTFALAAAITALQEEPQRRVAVVAPTQALKLQWASAAAQLGLHLDPAWSARAGRLPADMHGAVVTDQQVAAEPDALAEGGVVRPVHFPRVDGSMEWTAPDGDRRVHTFGERLDRVRAGQRLRTALSLDGDWLPDVLARAHRTLEGIRRRDATGAGLVIAADQEHAHGIARLLRDRVGTDPAVAVSEDPMASARIARFASEGTPWIVAVRMVSEGVDIPRLRVGMVATTTVTELYFRQAVGRLVRYQPGIAGQRAYLFIPDDERLRTFAAHIVEERRHSLARRSIGGEECAEGSDDAGARELGVGRERQLSLFAPISAVALDGTELAGAVPEGAPPPAGAEDPSLVVDRVPPPRGPQADDNDAGLSRVERKRALRDQNASRASELARLTGLSHRRVNAELNRLAGVRRIADATAAQLRARIDQADRWLRRL